MKINFDAIVSITLMAAFCFCAVWFTYDGVLCALQKTKHEYDYAGALNMTPTFDVTPQMVIQRLDPAGKVKEWVIVNNISPHSVK